MNRTQVVVGIAAMAWMMSLAAAEPLDRTPPPERARLTGTITIEGCRPDLSQLSLQAVAAWRSLSGTRIHNPLADEVFHASIHRSPSDRRVYEYAIDGLRSGEAYRLVIHTDDVRCGKTLWRLPHSSLVIAGLDQTAAIQGSALRAQLEVLGPAIGRERERWVGADQLDFDDSRSALRSFRWRPNQGGIAFAELQVSTRVFPVPGDRASDPCVAEPLVYRRTFPVNRGTWTAIDNVDFGRIIRGRGVTRGPPETNPGPPNVEPGPPTAEEFAALTPRELDRLERGGPLYVRVMPLNADGQPRCAIDDAGIAPWVIFAKLNLDRNHQVAPPPAPPLTASVTLYQAPRQFVTPNGFKLPGPGDLCWRVTKAHLLGSHHHDVRFKLFNNSHYGEGTVTTVALPDRRYCWGIGSGGSSSGLLGLVEGFAGMITGIIDTVGSLVNDVAAFYESIKSFVIKVAAGAIGATGIADCGEGSVCEEALEYGLEIGLAAAGMPPSLPNFDTLVDQGFDYLAGEIAAQAGIPGPVAELASGQARKYVENAANAMKQLQQQSNQSATGVDWLAPDMGIDPGRLTILITGNGQEFTHAPFLFQNGNLVFGVSPAMRLPRQAPTPSNPLVVPITLRPFLGGLPQLSPLWSEYRKAVFNRNNWMSMRVAPTCARFIVNVLPPGGIYRLVEADLAAASDAAFPGDAFANCTF